MPGGELDERGAESSASLAILLFAAAVAYAVADLALTPRRDLDWIRDGVVGLGLAALWGASALALWGRARRLALVPYLGAFAMVVHGVVASIRSSGAGVPFLMAAPIVTVCVVRASRLLPGARDPVRPWTESA